MLENVLMEEMTSTQFALAVEETDTAILPVGSTEVLGDHGPLGADTMVARFLGERLGRQTNCLVAPTIPVGDALELATWPGTIAVRPDTLKALYSDICDSLIRSGLKRIFFLNSHFFNVRAIDHCGRNLRQRGVPVAQADWWRIAFSVADDLVESAESPKGHGGEVITSVVMAMCPELVRLDEASGETPKEEIHFYARFTAADGFITYPHFQDYCTSGAWGDPSLASVSKGEAIVERGIEKMAEFIREFRVLPYPTEIASETED